MKKYSVLIGILCIVTGFGYSQSNSGTINSTGNNNRAYIKQAGNMNTATLVQEGDLNNLRIRQDGNENQAEGTQIGDQLFGVIRQFGDGNTAVLHQDQETVGYWSTDTRVRQVGEENYVEQTVLGPENYGVVFQNGDLNIATQYLEVSSDGRIEQTGHSNYAEQFLIENSFSYTHIIQDGSYNRAIQYQKGTQFGATIDQTGDYNYAFQHQEEDNFALSISQFGNYNTSFQAQYGPADDEAGILQNGDYNMAQQFLEGTGTTYSFQESVQKGNDNSLTQMTWSSSNANAMWIDQIGDANTAVQLQGFTETDGTYHPDDMPSDNNYAEIWQEGFDNTAMQTQLGPGGHDAFTIQYGNANYAQTWQTGSGHMNSITQTGNANRAVVTQNN